METKAIYDCIIPLGESCNITFLLQNAKLKKQTSLFEWFVSKRLNHITTVLQNILSETDTVLTRGPHVCIGDMNIFSGHYSLIEFQPIYVRRKERFLETLRSVSSPLFVRFESSDNTYSVEDIDNFVQIIRAINPSLRDIKLLLITPSRSPVTHPNIITRFFDKHASDPYCTGREVNTFFKSILEEVGYNLQNTCEQVFTDRTTT